MLGSKTLVSKRTKDNSDNNYFINTTDISTYLKEPIISVKISLYIKISMIMISKI
jgi:hypothetical protein